MLLLIKYSVLNFCVTRRIIVMQHTVSKSVKNLTVKELINRLALRRKLFVNDFLAIKETNLLSILENGLNY